MNGFFTFLLSFISGYFISHYISHPKKKYHRLPCVKFKNVEILPNLKIHVHNTTYWIHHWLFLGAVALTSIVVNEGILAYLFVKGVLLGSVIQGLRYKDRFRIRNPRRG